MKTDTEPVEVCRLPLWRNCLEEMQKAGVQHGQTYKAEWFEERLKCARDDMRFGLSISEIRRELEKDGFYLSGRGQGGTQFVVLPPENNADVMLGYQRAAIDALRRGVVLGTNTRLDLLKPNDRQRHEKMLEKMATKAVLMQRSAHFGKMLHEDPKKLKG